MSLRQRILLNALAVGTPVIAIAYHKKPRGFMEQFGLREYCISDERLDGGKLVELFDRAVSCLDEITVLLQGFCRKRIIENA